MFCPNCGNEISLFADKCLSCGTNFKNLSLAERQALENSSKNASSRRSSRHATSRARSKSQKKRSSGSGNASKNRVTEVRIEYNNGIACKEGMSRKGTKLKKGSFKKRFNNEGIGFRLPHYGIGEY